MEEFIWRPLKTIREEIKENRGKRVQIFLCCCNKTLPLEGIITEVGENYAEIKVDCAKFIQAPALVVFPLSRVDGFIEIPSYHENGKSHRSVQHRSLRVKLDNFRGHCVTIIWCRCDEVKYHTGLLSEVHADYLELRNFNNTGLDLIVKLSNICAVERILAHPQIQCQQPHHDADHIPYIE